MRQDGQQYHLIACVYSFIYFHIYLFQKGIFVFHISNTIDIHSYAYKIKMKYNSNEITEWDK